MKKMTGLSVKNVCLFFLLLSALCSLSCQCETWYNPSAEEDKEPWKNKKPRTADPEPFPMDSKPLLIKGAKVMTANGKIYPKALSAFGKRSY